MATENTQSDGKRARSPLQQASSTTDNTTNTPSSPPSHPPLEYEDPQRFRDYVHSINFDDDDFSTDDMFSHPIPLPQPEVPTIIAAAELKRHAPNPQDLSSKELQQRAQDSQPVRGTGLGKTESRPRKRVRFDTPREDVEGSFVDVASERTDGEAVRHSCPSHMEAGGVVDTVEGGDSSSEDCTWSVDKELEGRDEDEEAQGIDARPSE